MWVAEDETAEKNVRGLRRRPQIRDVQPKVRTVTPPHLLNTTERCPWTGSSESRW
jgi:hypothetical protein